MKKILEALMLVVLFSVLISAGCSRDGAVEELTKEKTIDEIKSLQTKILASGGRKDHDLEAVKKQYSALCETIPGAVVLTTMKGDIIDANGAYLVMVGYTLEELKNLTYQQLTPVKWHEMEKRFVSSALEEDYVYFDKEYISKDGTIFPIALTGWIIKDKQGKPLGTGSFITRK